MEILLTTFNRAKYLTPSLRSLFESDLGDSTLHIYDDCSEQPEALEALDSISELAPLFNPQVKLHKNKVNLGCDKNITISARKVIEETGCDYIVTTDSDTVYNKDWLNFLKAQFEKDKIKSDGIAAISLFNAEAHRVAGKYDDDLNIKQSLGGMTVAVKSSYFFEMDETAAFTMRSDNSDGKPWYCWDWEVVYRSMDKGEKLLCSNKSYVQHIGKYGAHSRGDGSWDQCEDFIGEEHDSR
jgi:glycosyltransferase involved in cell wall biosynthesis